MPLRKTLMAWCERCEDYALPESWSLNRRNFLIDLKYHGWSVKGYNKPVLYCPRCSKVM